MSEVTKLHERFLEISTPMDPMETGTHARLKTLQNVRVIAYDFYGTLFLSDVGDIGIDDGKSDIKLFLKALEDSGAEILNKAAGKRGFELYNRVVKDEIDKLSKKDIEYPEPDIRTVWKRVLKQLVDDGLVSNVQNSTKDHISVEFEARMNPVWPVPGVIDTLRYFKEKNLYQGIISNSQFYTPIVLEALTGYSLSELGFHPGLLHWSYKEREKKPGLTFYKNYIHKLKSVDVTLEPEHVLYIGNDMLKDVYPAATLGMKTALFAGDKRSLKWRKDDPRCKNLEPDLVITSFDQLPECVKL